MKKKKKKKVGVLGYGGKVGKTLLTVMDTRFYLRLGQRHITTVTAEIEAEYMKVDIFVPEELQRFTKGLDLIVNCAGPSYHIKGIIADAAVAENIPYIDAFGGDLLEEHLADVDGTFIISAGSFPGFSGILPLYTAGKYFDQVENFYLISNNNEASSYGAVYDLLLSSLHQFGKSNSYYAQGQVCYCKQTIKDWEGFDPRWHYSEYINNETIQVAKILGAKEAHWINVQKDTEQIQLINQLAKAYFKTADKTIIDQMIKDKITSQEIDESWFRIACEMRGVKNNKQRRVYTFFEFSDSYRVGSSLLNSIIKKVISENDVLGTVWAFEYLDPVRVLEEFDNICLYNRMKIICENVMAQEEGEI